MILAPLIVAMGLMTPSIAEAARCARGMIYRPSLGICQARSTYGRSNVRKKRFYRPKVGRWRTKAVVVRPAPRAVVQDSPGPSSIVVTPQIQLRIDLQNWLTPEKRREFMEDGR